MKQRYFIVTASDEGVDVSAFNTKAETRKALLKELPMDVVAVIKGEELGTAPFNLRVGYNEDAGDEDDYFVWKRER